MKIGQTRLDLFAHFFRALNPNRRDQRAERGQKRGDMPGTGRGNGLRNPALSAARRESRVSLSHLIRAEGSRLGRIEGLLAPPAQVGEREREV